MLLTAVSFIFVFGLMVVCHELGHFLLAKMNGIIVNEFSVGIGPKIFSWGKGETSYSLRAFPVGGYVKMEGEDDVSDNPRGFTNQRPWRRLTVIAAGPVMNFVLAVLLLALVAFSFGFPVNVVDEVYADGPAERAGLMEGDRILEVDGVPIEIWSQVGETIQLSDGQIDMLIERDGAQQYLTVTPEKEDASGRWVIGVIPQMKKSVVKSIGYGVDQTVFLFKSIFGFLSDLIGGGEVEGEIIGPVGIIGVVGEAARTGFQSLLFVAAYLSINLGIINLLPFPALDGGRLIFIVVELLRGKPVPPEKEGFVHFVGFAILMMLMVLILMKDLRQLF